MFISYFRYGHDDADLYLRFLVESFYDTDYYSVTDLGAQAGWVQEYHVRTK